MVATFIGWIAVSSVAGWLAANATAAALLASGVWRGLEAGRMLPVTIISGVAAFVVASLVALVTYPF